MPWNAKDLTALLLDTMMGISTSVCQCAGKYRVSDICIQSTSTLSVLASGPENQECLCKFMFTEDREAHENETALQAMFAPPLPVPGMTTCPCPCDLPPSLRANCSWMNWCTTVMVLCSRICSPPQLLAFLSSMPRCR